MILQSFNKLHLHNKTPIKTLDSQPSKWSIHRVYCLTSILGWLSDWTELNISLRTWKLSIWNCSRLHPMCLCLWLVLIYILHKTLSIPLYQVLCFSMKWSNLRESVGIPKSAATQSAIKVILELLNLWLLSEVRARRKSCGDSFLNRRTLKRVCQSRTSRCLSCI